MSYCGSVCISSRSHFGLSIITVCHYDQIFVTLPILVLLGSRYVHTYKLMRIFEEKQFYLPFSLPVRTVLGAGTVVTYRIIDISDDMGPVQHPSHDVVHATVTKCLP